jgi:endoglycosylceramidase
MWEGVQPREDVFDGKYLERMVNIVNEASKYHIYTLVEFHQDLFSQKFCGNGVPLWAVPK